MDSEDIVVSMTPPTSPRPPVSLHTAASLGRHSNSTAAATTTMRDKCATSVTSVTASASTSATATSPSSRPNSQDGPIDLSMKSTSSGGSSAKAASPNHDHHHQQQHHHRDFGSDEDGVMSSEDELNVDKRPSSADSVDRPASRTDGKTTLENASGLLIKGTPLDLTTKI